MEEVFYKNRDAVAILRVSSVRQEDGISHQVQEQKCREYCEINKLNLIKVYVLTESAKRSDDRKKYHEAMGFIKKNGHFNILFYSQDREARNGKDFAENTDSVYIRKTIFHNCILEFKNQKRIIKVGDSPSLH